MSTTPMLRLFAVVLNRDAERVTGLLLRRGVVHFTDPGRLRWDWADRIQKPEQDARSQAAAELRRRAGELLRAGGYTPGRIERGMPAEPAAPAGEELERLDLEEARRTIDRFSERVRDLEDRQRETVREMERIRDLQQQVKAFGPALLKGGLAQEHAFVKVRAGRVPEGSRSMFERELGVVPAAVIPLSPQSRDAQSRDAQSRDAQETSGLLVVSMKRDDDRVRPVLERFGWKELRIPEHVRDMRQPPGLDLEEKITALAGRRAELEQEKRRLIEGGRNELEKLWERLRIAELSGTIKDHFRKTGRTVLFSGWIPASRLPGLERELREVTGGHCYLEWNRPGDGEPDMVQSSPPVELRNPRLLRPFQMLVTGYGVPEYGTVDPTLFVAAIFLIMFGLMFSDAGQGVVLVLAGLLGARWSSEEGRLGPDLFRLIAWCGASSVLFGVLFGSYFGMPWMPPVLFDFHGVVSGHPEARSLVNDLFDILSISLYFGIAVIGTGLLFNWVNLVRKRRWGELLVGRAGVTGGWIFAGGVYVAGYLVHHGYRELPAALPLFLLVGLPAVAIFLKPVLAHFLGGAAGESGGFALLNLLMGGVVELLEVFSGYLSNTLSFLRVAGFGIAHVSLMTAFFELARMASGGTLLSPGALAILVAGNILVIGLEGLSAGVQSLRLNYYEFFTKFFTGTGTLYSPVSLRSSVEGRVSR